MNTNKNFWATDVVIGVSNHNKISPIRSFLLQSHVKASFSYFVHIDLALQASVGYAILTATNNGQWYHFTMQAQVKWEICTSIPENSFYLHTRAFLFLFLNSVLHRRSICLLLFHALQREAWCWSPQNDWPAVFVFQVSILWKRREESLIDDASVWASNINSAYVIILDKNICCRYTKTEPNRWAQQTIIT